MNKQIQILQAIGIILVVVGHKCIGTIPTMLNVFFIYSYHMALFVFISGYLFKDEHIKDVKGYIAKKFKHLVIPYYIYNLIYGIIFTSLKKANIISYGLDFSFESFFVCGWTHGHQFSFNLAMWFVLSLFCIQVIYILIRKATEHQRINPFALLIILLTIGVGSIIVHTKYPSEALLPLTRTLFLLPFFHLGYICKSQKEISNMDLRKAIYLLFSTTVIIAAIIILKKTGHFPFNYEYYAVHMRFNGLIILPYFVSILGIAFWFSFSKITENNIGNWTITKKISRASWDIMAHHLFIFFLINLFFYTINAKGFDFTAFNQDQWYTYLTPDKLFLGIYLYHILAIYIPIKLRDIIETIKNHSFNKIE